MQLEKKIICDYMPSVLKVLFWRLSAEVLHKMNLRKYIFIKPDLSS